MVLSLGCTLEIPGRLWTTAVSCPHTLPPLDHLIIICRHETQASVVFKAPQVIPAGSQYWEPLVYLFSLCPWKYRTYGTSMTSPIPVLALIYSVNFYWTSILWQAMVYMLRISREQEKKANWEIVLVLIMLDFLYMLPTFHPRARLLLAAKVGLLKRCCRPGSSVLTSSSIFLGPLENLILAFVHLTVFLTPWVLRKLIHTSQPSLEKGKSRVFFPSCANFPFSLSLCLSLPGLRVIDDLPNLSNTFL